MMLHKQVWISILNLLTIPTTAKLKARAASPSASSSSAQLILANEAAAATSYNPNDLLPTQMSALYQILQDTPTATPSLTTQAISYDAGSFTAAAAAATTLAGILAAEQSTAIIIPPPINNPLTAAPPPEATSPTTPFLYLGSNVPAQGYYVVATAPYPIANASTGLGIAPENVSGIVPFTGKACGRWEMGSRWQWSMIMSWSAVVVLGRVFL